MDGEHKSSIKKNISDAKNMKSEKNVERVKVKLKNIIVQSPQARYSINYRFFLSLALLARSLALPSLGHRVCSTFSLSSLWKLDVNT